MTTERIPVPAPSNVRRNAIWPWLVMPMIVLALFAILHNVRRSGGDTERDAPSGVGIP